MVQVLASIRVKESAKAAFLQIFKENVPKVLNEAGCLEYVPTIDYRTELPSQVLDENVVTIIEKWESLPHLQAHLVSPHMLEYREKVKDMVESVDLKILQPA